VTGRQRWLTALLASWALSPLALLLMRALAPSWPYPVLTPDTVATELVSSLETGRIAAALGTSVILALLTGALSAAGGFVIGRGVVKAGRLATALVVAAALFPVIAPPIAFAIGLQVVALQAGLAGTLTGVWLAHLVPATGYVTLFAIGVLSSFEISIEDEARTLGANTWQVFRRVTMPLLGARIAEAALLGALVSWGQLATSLLVGGGLIRTLPIELLSLVRSGDDQHGALAALLLTVPPLLALGLLQAGTRRTGATL